MNSNSFANNPNLKEVAILSTATSECRDAFRALEKQERLSLGRCLGGQNAEVALSPKSPLMKDILNGRQEPNGYTVLPPGSD